MTACVGKRGEVKHFNLIACIRIHTTTLHDMYRRPIPLCPYGRVGDVDCSLPTVSHDMGGGASQRLRRTFTLAARIRRLVVRCIKKGPAVWCHIRNAAVFIFGVFFRPF